MSINGCYYTVDNPCLLASSEVTFDIKLTPWTDSNCDSMNDFHEGVELSFRNIKENVTGEWIPLMYYASNSNPGNISEAQSPISLAENIPDDINITHGNFTLRGYSVPYVIESGGKHTISLCKDETVLRYPLQFRWLQTSLQVHDGISDVIVLDNITISVHSGTQRVTLYEDDFDHQNSSE